MFVSFRGIFKRLLSHKIYKLVTVALCHVSNVSATFCLYIMDFDENKLHFNEMMLNDDVCCVLHQHGALNVFRYLLIFIVSIDVPFY
jgi:hypothetical protein